MPKDIPGKKQGIQGPLLKPNFRLFAFLKFSSFTSKRQVCNQTLSSPEDR